MVFEKRKGFKNKIKMKKIVDLLYKNFKVLCIKKIHTHTHNKNIKRKMTSQGQNTPKIYNWEYGKLIFLMYINCLDK